MIVVGVGIFMYKDNVNGGKSSDSSMIGTGELLLVKFIKLILNQNEF